VPSPYPSAPPATGWAKPYPPSFSVPTRPFTWPSNQDATARKAKRTWKATCWSGN